MKLVGDIAGSESERFDWDMGWQLAKELLEGINFISRDTNRKRFDGNGFKVYWAGNILRVDIDKEQVRG